MFRRQASVPQRHLLIWEYKASNGDLVEWGRETVETLSRAHREKEQFYRGEFVRYGGRLTLRVVPVEGSRA